MIDTAKIRELNKLEQHDPIIGQCLDEIDRLRAESRDLCDRLDARKLDRAALDAAMIEIDRLRSELLRLEHTRNATIDECDDLEEINAELLAACKAVVEEDGFRGSALMRKRVDDMKAAIAKAEKGAAK